MTQQSHYWAYTLGIYWAYTILKDTWTLLFIALIISNSQDMEAT